jgi:hypothetical protein
MTLVLKRPFEITSGLYPGLRFDDAVVECREGLQFAIRFDDGHEHLVKDFRPGAGMTLQQCFASILDFLYTWVDALRWVGELPPDEIDGLDWFPADDDRIVKWAKANEHRFQEVCEVLEDKEGLLVEEE